MISNAQDWKDLTAKFDDTFSVTFKKADGTDRQYTISKAATEDAIKQIDAVYKDRGYEVKPPKPFNPDATAVLVYDVIDGWRSLNLKTLKLVSGEIQGILTTLTMHGE